MTTTKASPLADLVGRLDGEVLTDDVSRLVYASAACLYRIEPVGVVLPKNIDDVVKTVRFCRENSLPVIARGGGTGLAGQAIGRGVVIDFTRYMDALLEIDPEGNTVRVQPGVTYAVLNEHLKSQGKYLPPDPSSGNRATLGGMIGNNASGPHSLKYGSTIDYVLRLKLVTDAGEVIDAETKPLDEVSAAGGRAAELYAGAARIALRYAQQIEKCTPKTHKNSSGYRLDRLIEHDGGNGAIHLEKLLCASEGTLGVIVEAELAIADPPACTELTVLIFTDLQPAADSVPLIMQMEPSALEAMDRNAAKVVRERRPEMRKFLPEEAELLIFVEFDGPEREPLLEKVRQLKDQIITKRQMATGSVQAADKEEQEMLWGVRKAVLPILSNLPGPKRISPFIEDAAVPVAAIPRYIAGLRKILENNDAPFAILGHAGQGNFHVRPMLDLCDPDEVKKMADIAEEVTDLVMSLGGTLSGEHGDGLVRSQFLRRQYGELYPAFEEIKQLFDPDNIFNPGKIVGADQTLCDNLKFSPDYAARRTVGRTELLFDEDEYVRLVEKCQGCGICRVLTDETVMCPIFKALKDERISPRGKISVLRELLAGNLRPTPDNREHLGRVFELCLNCGMCTLQCPALAEVPLLINEARARQSKTDGVPRLKRLISLYPKLSRPLPAVLNRIGTRMLGVKLLRTIMEKLTGIDRRRDLPAIRPARKVRRVNVAQPTRRAAYFADLYASLHDPEIIDCALDVLEHNNVDVVYPRQRAVGIVAMTAGDLATAQRTVEYNLEGLGEAVADGRTVVCTEPTAALCLIRDYKRFTDDPAAGMLAAQVRELFEFLREMKNEGALKTDLAEINEEYLYHTPCHIAARDIGLPCVEILSMVPGLKINVLTRRCCGMAGSFGVAAKHYDLSAEIGRALFDEIKQSGCRKLLTECSACKMQIEQHTDVEVIHPVKLLHRAYEL